MMSANEVWHLAEVFVRLHGEESVPKARAHAELHRQRGEIEQHGNWLRIAAAAKVLLKSKGKNSAA